jgi:hypothetical protein
MAITQGINGTFFPAQEYETVEPIYFRKFKKTVSVGGVWEDRIFYEISKFPMGRSNTEIWLSEKYGPPKYSNTWWTTHNSICMTEKIYTHYKLLE